MLLNVGTELILSDRGLAPRALRDIEAATPAGRFVADPVLALALAAGALLGLGQLLHDQPERDDAASSDQMAEHLLRVYGRLIGRSRSTEPMTPRTTPRLLFPSHISFALMAIDNAEVATLEAIDARAYAESLG